MGLLWNLIILSTLAVVLHEVAHAFLLSHPSELSEPLAYAKRLSLEAWQTACTVGQDFAARWR